MSNLKPCPFCGFEYISLHILQDDGRTSGVFVECPQCGIETTIYGSVEEAVEFWNRRSDAED